MEGGKADRRFVRWQSSEFEEEGSSSDSGNDGEAMRQLYIQKMQQAQVLKESSIDMPTDAQDLKVLDKGPTVDSQASQNKSEVKDLVAVVVENRSTDQLSVQNKGEILSYFASAQEVRSDVSE